MPFAFLLALLVNGELLLLVLALARLFAVVVGARVSLLIPRSTARTRLGHQADCDGELDN